MMNRGNTNLLALRAIMHGEQVPCPQITPREPPRCCSRRWPLARRRPFRHRGLDILLGIPGFMSSLVEGNDPGSGTGPTAVDLATAAARSCPIGLQ